MFSSSLSHHVSEFSFTFQFIFDFFSRFTLFIKIKFIHYSHSLCPKLGGSTEEPIQGGEDEELGVCSSSLQ